MLNVCMGLLALLIAGHIYTSSYVSEVTSIKVGIIFTVLLSVLIQQSYGNEVIGQYMGPYLLVSYICLLSLCARFTEYTATAFLCNGVEWPPFALTKYGTLSPILMLHTAKYFGSFIATCFFYYWLTN